MVAVCLAFKFSETLEIGVLPNTVPVYNLGPDSGHTSQITRTETYYFDNIF